MRKISFLICAAIIFTGSALSGCVSVASSPNPRFYMPDSVSREEAVEKIDIAPGMIIAIGPVSIPEYLDRPQMVTKNKDGTLLFAQFDRWGEPLDSGIARLLNEGLASLLPQASFQLFPCNFTIPLNYQVIVEIIQLESELNKDMALTAQWSIIDAKSRKLLLTRRSQVIKPIDPHNYSGLSKALGAACFSLSKEIAVNLSALSKLPKSVKEPVEAKTPV